MLICYLIKTKKDTEIKSTHQIEHLMFWSIDNLKCYSYVHAVQSNFWFLMIRPLDILTQIKGKQLVIDHNKELALFIATVYWMKSSKFSGCTWWTTEEGLQQILMYFCGNESKQKWFLQQIVSLHQIKIDKG